MDLTPTDREMLDGRFGAAVSHAMALVVEYGQMVGAREMVDITGAHVDACLYHGLAGVEYAEHLRDLHGRVRVPTTLNVSSLDLLHPHLVKGDNELQAEAKRLMQAYVDMGCRPSWTCAPYQVMSPPRMGEHIAWAESNAVVFANSVLGARTERYGDFLDVAAALTGRVPAVGLHRDRERVATTLVDVTGLPLRLREQDAFYPVLGHILGREVTGVPAIVGIPAQSHWDNLKALGAAGASSGALAMFHAVGITPEAPTIAHAFQGAEPKSVLNVTMEMIRQAFGELSTGRGGTLVGVSVGTPHFSAEEMRYTVALLKGRRISDTVDFFVSTSRDVYRQMIDEGVAGLLMDAGVELVVDTCTYITPIIRNKSGVFMTNSGKWAYYAPGNLGIDVIFGSLKDCVESAVSGQIHQEFGLGLT